MQKPAMIGTLLVAMAILVPFARADSAFLGAVMLCFESNDLSSVEVQVAAKRQADPQSREAQWAEAEVLRRRHALAASEALLTPLLQREPADCRATVSLARIRFDQARFMDALKLARAVTGQQPETMDRTTLAMAFALSGGAEGMLAHHGGVWDKLSFGRSAIRAMGKAAGLGPDVPEILYARGSFALIAPAVGGGNLEAAVTLLQSAVERAPWHAEAWARLAQAYRAQGDTVRAEACMAKALNLDPESPLVKDVRDGTGIFGRVAGSGR